MCWTAASVSTAAAAPPDTATTIPSQSALKKAEVFNSELFFNPSSLYSGGLNCAREIRDAKQSIINNLGALNHEVIFTSCGSESDNMAIFCSVKRGMFVTDKGEHSAVYKSFLELKNRGQKVEFIDLIAAYKANSLDLAPIKQMVEAGQVDLGKLQIDLFNKIKV